MRPLDRATSIKAKLSLVIVAAVAIAAAVSVLGLRWGVPVLLRPPIAAAMALLLVYPFSRGITAPLREMAEASRALAEGRYDSPITTASRDEVGELARAFESMRSDLADAERQRRELVANASHELRTPLAALQARLENMVDGVEAVDGESLERTLVQVRDLGDLVNQLLDLSRLESGGTRLDRERLDVAELSGEIADETALSDPSVRIEVTARGHTEVLADRLRLGQVLRNLLANAIRHAPSGSTVSVHTDLVGGDLRVVVADEGPGVPSGEEERVFERFRRGTRRVGVDEDPTGPLELPRGSGLGLAITRSIVELHGGSVHLEPNRPVGCRAVVRLPVDA